MIVLSCKDIMKSYGIDVILKSATFTINEGDKVGFIGANGAGKTTLFKIMTSQLSPDSGDFYVDKSKRLGYLSQHLSLESSSSLYEEVLKVFQSLVDMENRINELTQLMKEPYEASKKHYHEKLIEEFTTLSDLYNHRGGYTYRGEIHRVLKGLGFSEEDFNKEIDILSGGQKTRVALSKLLLTSPEILLLDEPTNHLDLEAIEWLEEYLKSYKGTMIIISHDRFFLDGITNRTFELLNGKVYCYNGSYTVFLQHKKDSFEAKLKAYNLQQSEIKRQEEIIARYRSFNREKSIRAAESREKALSKIDRLEAPDKEHKISPITFSPAVKSGNDVLHVENLSKSYDRDLFKAVELDIKRGERIALIGDNGRGKTTLFKILLGRVSPNDGIVYFGKNVHIGYYDQEQSDLHPEKSVLDEVWDDYPDLTVTEIRTRLGAFLFSGDDVFKKVSDLSGGEKCRINLLKLMLSGSNLLLLDEPTNHLDIPSREALEDALLNYDGTLLVISHDRYFLNKVVEKILELEEEGLKEYLGNYSYYVEKKKNPNRFQIIEEQQGKTKTQLQEEKRKKREQERLEKELKQSLKQVEGAIASKEEELVKLQNLLCEEEIYSNPEKSEETHKAILELENTIAELYEEWEALM